MVLGCPKKQNKTKRKKEKKNLNDCQKMANQTEDNLPHD